MVLWNLVVVRETWGQQVHKEFRVLLVRQGFYLCNETAGEIVSDLDCTLNKGTTVDMNFSETNVVDIYAPATLHLVTKIDDENNSDVKFTYINLLMKRL